MIQVQFKDFLFNRRLGGWMGKAVRTNPVIAAVVSSNPSGGNFIFADFETPWCQFCTKMPEISDLCYLGKTQLHVIQIVKFWCFHKQEYNLELSVFSDVYVE